MVIFTILLSLFAAADSPVPNPGCRLLYRHDDLTRLDVQKVLLLALYDQKTGPCTKRGLSAGDPIALCAPFREADTSRINRRLFLKGLPRDTTLDPDELNASALTIAGLADRIMSHWDELYCRDGIYR